MITTPVHDFAAKRRSYVLLKALQSVSVDA